MIIAVSGKKGHGKDVVTSMLQYLNCTLNSVVDDREHMKRFLVPGSNADNNLQMSTNLRRKRFADPIKDFVCVLIGCTRDQLEDRDFKEKELGEEWWKYRIITKGFPNYYVSTLEEAKNNIRHKNQRYVLVKLTPRKLLQLVGTECGREILHPNIWINAMFSDYSEISNIIIPDLRFKNEKKAILDRGGFVIRVERPSVKNTSDHISETDLDGTQFHYDILNEGSIDDLYVKVRMISDHINSMKY